jgi:hypothetical protein
MRHATLALVVLLAASGCAQKQETTTTSSTSTSTPAPAPDTAVETHAVTPAFAGKTWRVTESTAVAPGTKYEFRSDGTLVVSSPNSTPLEGRWKWAEGNLTLTEEGIDYPTDILGLDETTFRIRSHNPGTPVDITLVRDQP